MGNKLLWIVLLVVVMIGTITDGITSGLTLLAIIEGDNIFSMSVAMAGGLIITGFSTTTKIALDDASPILLKFLWFIAVAIDIVTTVSGTIFYLIMGNEPDTPIDFDIVIDSLTTFESHGWGRTIVIFAAVILITGSSIISLYVLEKVFK